MIHPFSLKGQILKIYLKLLIQYEAQSEQINYKYKENSLYDVSSTTNKT